MTCCCVAGLPVLRHEVNYMGKPVYDVIIHVRLPLGHAPVSASEVMVEVEGELVHVDIPRCSPVTVSNRAALMKSPISLMVGCIEKAHVQPHGDQLKLEALTTDRAVPRRSSCPLQCPARARWRSWAREGSARAWACGCHIGQYGAWSRSASASQRKRIDSLVPWSSSSI